MYIVLIPNHILAYQFLKLNLYSNRFTFATCIKLSYIILYYFFKNVKKIYNIYRVVLSIFSARSHCNKDRGRKTIG